MNVNKISYNYKVYDWFLHSFLIYSSKLLEHTSGGMYDAEGGIMIGHMLGKPPQKHINKETYKQRSGPPREHNLIGEGG